MAQYSQHHKQGWDVLFLSWVVTCYCSRGDGLNSSTTDRSQHLTGQNNREVERNRVNLRSKCAQNDLETVSRVKENKKVLDGVKGTIGSDMTLRQGQTWGQRSLTSQPNKSQATYPNDRIATFSAARGKILLVVLLAVQLVSLLDEPDVDEFGTARRVRTNEVIRAPCLFQGIDEWTSTGVDRPSRGKTL